MAKTGTDESQLPLGKPPTDAHCACPLTNVQWRWEFQCSILGFSLTYALLTHSFSLFFETEGGEPASQVKDERSEAKPESQSTVKIEVVCTDDGESSTHSAGEEE